MALMGIKRDSADVMFKKAKALEQGTDPIYVNKVEMPKFLKANHIDVPLLTEQIKREEELNEPKSISYPFLTR